MSTENNGNNGGNSPYSYSKLNPIISNVIYFILAFYSIGCVLKNSDLKLKTTKYNKTVNIILITFAVLSILAGSLSINYHQHTPAFTENPEYHETEQYKVALGLDNGFALTFAFFALLIWIIYFGWSLMKLKGYDKFNLIFDGNFWMAILFLTLSLLSYFGAGIFWRSSKDECEDAEFLGCFKTHQKEYNVYHSFWHLFSGFAGFFWVLTVCGVIRKHMNMRKLT